MIYDCITESIFFLVIRFLSGCLETRQPWIEQKAKQNRNMAWDFLESHLTISLFYTTQKVLKKVCDLILYACFILFMLVFFLRWFPYNRFPAATADEKCWTILATTVFHTVYSYIYLWSLGSSRQSSSLSNWSRNYRHNRKSVAFIWSHQSLKVICSDGSSRVEQWYDKQSSEHLRKRKSGKLIEFLGPTRLYPGNVLSYITKCSREHTARYDWSIIPADVTELSSLKNFSVSRKFLNRVLFRRGQLIEAMIPQYGPDKLVTLLRDNHV